MSAPRILAFAGSVRKESYNKKLVHLAAAGARRAGADVTLIDLKDYPMPIYDGDHEATFGIPENGIKLKKLFLEHQGLLLSCPEYNSSHAPVFKNTIDWVSRPVPGEAPLACFNGKAAVLMSASPGALGGLRGLVHARSMLGNINVVVLPQQFALSKAADSFNEDGTLKDAKQQAAVEGLGQTLAEFLKKINSH